MAATPKKRRIRKATRLVREAFLAADWCITREKYDQIVAFLEMRAQGDQLTQEEITEAISGNKFQDREKSVVTKDGILVLDIYGVLAPRLDMMTQISGGTSLASIESQALKAIDDEEIKSVILRIDSPGGTVVGTQEAGEAIQKLAKRKRVVTSASGLFASAAYWLGVSSGKGNVFASSSTVTGSIGVFSVRTNEKRASDEEGVDYTVFRAGRLKAALHPNEEWTIAQIQDKQRQIDASFDSFISHVAESRGVAGEVVKSQFGEGSTFTADEAMARGMIDGVMTFDEVLARERDRLSSSSSVSFVTVKGSEMKVSAKVKAALFARGLVVGNDASDEICVSVLGAFAIARGESIESMDEDQQLALILSQETSAGAVVNPPLVFAQPAQPVPIAPVDPVNPEADIPRVAATVRATGRSMPHVSAEMISDALVEVIDGSATLDQIVTRWTSNAQDLEPDLPVIPVASQVDKFNSGALAWAVAKSNGEGEHLLTSEDRSNGASLSYMRFEDIARMSLNNAGVRRIEANPALMAKQFLTLGGSEERGLPDLAAGGSVNYSGDHPALVDIIANKVLWQPFPIADYKFEQWCGKISDVSNFDPHHFVETSIFGEMAEFTETDNVTPELKFNSEFKVWYEASRLRNKVGLSVEMIIGDKVGGFMRQLSSLANLPRKTMNRSALTVLNQNPVMADSNALFSAAHGNIIASGAAPNSTQASAMRKLHRLMVGYAADEMDTPPSRSLHPAEHEEAALQAFTSSHFDPKVANTDATINTVRGEITPIIDARLDAYSTKFWYTFVNPQASPVIAYFYMNGYQNSGVRETWYDPESTRRYYALEARQGTAAVDWRGMVRNAGE